MWHKLDVAVPYKGESKNTNTFEELLEAVQSAQRMGVPRHAYVQVKNYIGMGIVKFLRFRWDSDKPIKYGPNHTDVLPEMDLSEARRADFND